MTVKHLPVLNNEDVNSTPLSAIENTTNNPSLQAEQKKDYISYSELSTWMECNYRHKLKYIDKIKLDGPSEHTEFGTLIHEILEEFLKTKKLPEDYQVYKDKLTKMFDILPPKEGGRVLPEKDWQNTIEPIIKSFPDFMDKTFPGWEYFETEYELFEKIDDEEEKKFKGYVDAIIKVPNKKGKIQYVICDYKTTSFGWTLDKKTDPKKTMQLVLYKYLLARKLNIELTDIKCYFILLKRTTKKERCEPVVVSVGPKTIAKAIELMERFLNTTRMGLFPKDRNNCTYCVYKNTKHCEW